MKQDERGYIVVEAIAAFLPFVLLIVSILSLVNIVTVQARVHYAMTQAANALSMYSYTLEVTGVAKDLATLTKHSNKVDKEIEGMRSDIEGVLNGVESLSAGEVADHGQAAADRLYGWGESMVTDPKAIVQDLLNYGINEARNKLTADYLVRPLVGRYLRNGTMTGDEYLKSMHVIGGLDGLEFQNMFSGASGDDTVIIDEKGDITLVARYEIEYDFAALPLPFDKPALSVTQIVKTKAWLNGSGEGYRWDGA